MISMTAVLRVFGASPAAIIVVAMHAVDVGIVAIGVARTIFPACHRPQAGATGHRPLRIDRNSVVRPPGFPMSNRSSCDYLAMSSSRSSCDDDPNTLFVGNLPAQTTHQELRTEFSAFGETLGIMMLDPDIRPR